MIYKWNNFKNRFCFFVVQKGKKLLSTLVGLFCVNEMSVSCDNQFIATASNDNTVRIWDYSKCLKYANSTECQVFTCGTPGNETEALAVTG